MELTQIENNTKNEKLQLPEKSENQELINTKVKLLKKKNKKYCRATDLRLLYEFFEREPGWRFTARPSSTNGRRDNVLPLVLHRRD